MSDAKSWDIEGKRNKLYGRRWRKGRGQFLAINRYCKFCRAVGKRARATVVDHIVPHRGDEELFWEQSNWQPLCKPCHDGEKAVMEARGYSDRIGVSGWPVDPAHPSNGGAPNHQNRMGEDTDGEKNKDLVSGDDDTQNTDPGDEVFVI